MACNLRGAPAVVRRDCKHRVGPGPPLSSLRVLRICRCRHCATAEPPTTQSRTVYRSQTKRGRMGGRGAGDPALARAPGCGPAQRAGFRLCRAVGSQSSEYLAVLSRALAEYGFDAILKGVLNHLRANRTTNDEIRETVDGYWFVFSDLSASSDIASTCGAVQPRCDGSGCRQTIGGLTVLWVRTTQCDRGA